MIGPVRPQKNLFRLQMVSGGGNDLFVADEGGQLVGSAFTYSGKVYDYPQGGGAVTQVGGSTLVAPSALALNAAGDLYIADYSLGAIYVASAANRGDGQQVDDPGRHNARSSDRACVRPQRKSIHWRHGDRCHERDRCQPRLYRQSPRGGWRNPTRVTIRSRERRSFSPRL